MTMARMKVYMLMWLVAAAVISSRGENDEADDEIDDGGYFGSGDLPDDLPDDMHFSSGSNGDKSPSRSVQAVTLREEAGQDHENNDVKYNTATDASSPSSSSAANRNPLRVVYVILVLCMFTY